MIKLLSLIFVLAAIPARAAGIQDGSGPAGTNDPGMTSASPGTNRFLAYTAKRDVYDNDKYQTVRVSVPDRSAAGRVPLMGYNIWQHAGAGWTADWLTNQVNIMLTNGFLAAGYRYIITDDGSFVRRDPAGNLVCDPAKYPQGIAATAAWLHRLGFRFGIYTEPDFSTCAGYAGSDFDHIEQDCAFFKSFGLDYLKLDTCGWGKMGLLCDTNSLAWVDSRFAAALDAGTNRVILDSGFGQTTCPENYNFLRSFPVVNLWRSSNPALANGPDQWVGYGWWTSVKNLDVAFTQNIFDRPGHYASPETVWADFNLPAQYKGIMALEAVGPFPIEWAQYPAPGDTTNFDAIQSYMCNPDAIAINQDDSGSHGVIILSNHVAGGYDNTPPGGWEVIARPLQALTFQGATSVAVAFWERGSNTSATITMDFTNLGVAQGTPLVAQDIFSGTTCVVSNSITVSVGSQTAELWKFSRVGPSGPPRFRFSGDANLPASTIESRIGKSNGNRN